MILADDSTGGLFLDGLYRYATWSALVLLLEWHACAPNLEELSAVFNAHAMPIKLWSKAKENSKRIAERSHAVWHKLSRKSPPILTPIRVIDHETRSPKRRKRHDVHLIAFYPTGQDQIPFDCVWRTSQESRFLDFAAANGGPSLVYGVWRKTNEIQKVSRLAAAPRGTPLISPGLRD